VKPFGRNSAKIVFILDYPTKIEVERGQASAGYVGDNLQRWLKDADPTLNLSDCYVTHFVRDLLPGKIRKVDEKGFPKYVEKLGYDWNYYRDQIKEELQNLDPNIIFLVGEAAVQGLTGEKGLEKYRGTIVESDPFMDINPRYKLFPIFHPRQIQIKYSRKHITLADMIKGLRYKNDPDPFVSDISTWVCRSPNDLDRYFSRAERYAREHGTNISNDIETYFGFITAMGYSYDGKEGVSVPLVDKNISSSDLALINYKISSFFNDTGLGFTGHNYIYDTHYLHKHGFIDWDHFIVGNCTMNLGKLVYPELPASLAFYNSIYTLMPYFKDEGKEFDPGKTKKDQLFHYNAKDCISTFQVEQGLLKDAEEEGVLDLWKRRGAEYFHFYRKSDARGIRIDDEKRKEKINKYEAAVDLHTINLHNYFPGFNPLSPNQVKALLYEEMALPKKYKRSATTGKQVLRTDEIILQWFLLNLKLNEDQEDIINNVILARHYNKYLDYLTCLIHPDGRIRTHQKPFGAESMRSTTSYSMDQWHYLGKNNAIGRKNMGLSFQTVPKHGFRLPNGFEDGKDLREIFVPSPGYVFGGQDQSSAEARVVGILSEDEPLLERLESGQDVHVWTASFILGKDPDDVTKLERQNIGKKTRHAGNYDMSPPKLAEIAQLRLVEAKTALGNFHKHSPNIREVFHKEVVKNIKVKGFLTTHFGNKRTFFDRLDNPSVHREGFSYIPQNVVCSNQRNGMIETEERLGREVRWLYEAHDGCLFEEKPDRLEEVFDTMRDIMERPIIMDSGSLIRTRPFVIPIDCESSDSNWNELRKWKR
jgi:DNA polymerase I-like protein with 3'-5' exonuclease and polymerase domains/uracil-DNA glycosylase